MVQTTHIQFVPTRGMRMEFSGNIADACWTDKYMSIAEVMPNMTAVIMKQNPGNSERERFIGAALLIESTSQNGEPLLIVRGLNPIENYINHVSVEDFYDKFMDYAAGIARARNRQLAIVIDSRVAAAATNRPVLFGYLDEKKHKSLKRVVVNTADTTFNRYDITHDTYLATHRTESEH